MHTHKSVDACLYGDRYFCVDILYSYVTVLRVHFIPRCQILSDKPRLIRRTQLKRSAYIVVGADHQGVDTDGQQVTNTVGQTLHFYSKSLAIALRSIGKGSPQNHVNKVFLPLLLLGLFPSSGVAGMVMNIILPFYPVQ